MRQLLFLSIKASPHRALRVALACLLGSAATGIAAPTGDFVLRDHIGREWRNECVTFALSPAQLAHAKAGHALRGANGPPLVYQLVSGTPPRIAFQTDLNPFETRAIRFAGDTGKPVTDLKIEEFADRVTLSNSRIAVTLATKLSEGGGPLLSVRLPSGKAVGGSSLRSPAPPTGYSATITARGPVFAEVVCKVVFVDSGTWEIKFQLQANEPVVCVEEVSAVTAPDVNFVVFPDSGLDADKLLYRTGKGQINQNKIGDIAPGEVCVLEPWLHWWERERQGPCLSLFNSAGEDVISFGAGWAGRWIDPKIKWEEQANPRIFVKKDDQGLSMTFPLRKGQRQWIITALRKDAALEGFDEKDAFKSLLAYQYMTKHGQFPLDTVKDYVYSWKGDHDNYPRLLVTRKDVERFRKSIEDLKPYQGAIPQYVKGSQYKPKALNQFNMEAPITAYLATADAALGKHLGDATAAMMQRAINRVVLQPDMVFGAAPHHFQDIAASVLLADAALSNPEMDLALRERILGQIAFLGYTVARPDYWSTGRGFAANPNMTTSVYGYQTTIACAIPEHPLAAEWTKKGMAELKTMVDEWSDDNGGWLEAPHYAMAAADQILASFVMANNAGFNDYLYSPRLRIFLNWFSKISTPPDSRVKGWRHLPPVGNTYLQEPTGEFGIVAYLFRDKDPEFSAQMQWMHQQHGSFSYPGIGGGYPGFAGYRAMMVDPKLPSKPPAWKSELFPQTGAILRNIFPSDRETTLHIIHGQNHAHYDDDSGSVTIWGKGRILADDFGYYVPDRADHSMIESPVATGIMQMKDFKTPERLDYVRGIQSGWTRQIAFVKDTDPLGPNYFVIADSFQAPALAKWRLFFAAQNVTTDSQGAFVEGREDVDADVFFAAPVNPSLTTVPTTRTANYGLDPNGRPGKLDSTQIGLTATLEREKLLNVVVYPRLKTEPAPTFASLADGRGVQIKHLAGVDYAFLSPTPIKFKQDDVEFEGTVGAIQIRNGKPILSLGAAGRIAAAGKVLQEGSVSAVGPVNLLEGGDFESGKQSLLTEDTNQYNCTAKIYEGNPAKNDPNHKGKYCAVLHLRWKSGMTWPPRAIFIDPTKRYRFSFRYYTTTNMATQYGGYGNDSKGQAKDDMGRVWEWAVVIKGPTEKWETTETTLGPAGSGARWTWLPGLLSTGLVLRISGDENLTMYVDDFVFEEVDE